MHIFFFDPPLNQDTDKYLHTYILVLSSCRKFLSWCYTGLYYDTVYSVSQCNIAITILSGVTDTVMCETTNHTGAVRCLDVNPFQPNLLVSGASESEIYIWDLNNPTTPMSPGNKTQVHTYTYMYLCLYLVCACTVEREIFEVLVSLF